MGASRNEARNGSITFLNLRGGKFVRKVDPSTVEVVSEAELHKLGFRERKYENKETGKEEFVLEEWFDSVDGIIVGASLEQPQYGGIDLKILLRDNLGELTSVAIPYSDGTNIYQFAKSFIQKIPNLNLEETVIIEPYKFEDKIKSAQKGRTVYAQGVHIYQHSEKIKNSFTKDNPNGVPEAKQVTKMGKLTWDFTAVNDFLHEVATNFIAEIVAAHPVTTTGHDRDTTTGTTTGNSGDTEGDFVLDDDLPF